MSWTLYLLLVNVYLIIFYGFYRLLLAKETFFVLNRIYLLGASICSLTIPLIKLDWFAKQQLAADFYVQVSQANDMIGGASQVLPLENTINWGAIISIIYIAGVLLFAVLLVVKLFKVKKMFRQNTTTAFSFWRKKVVTPNQPQAATINHHEDVHIKQLHTLDVLFFETLAIITWINPIIYLYKREIKNIHEYLADSAVVKYTGDKEAYAYLLLNHSFGVGNSNVISGFFNKSMVKKRISMLYKEKSKRTAILKYGFAVPLFAIALLLSAATVKNNDEINTAANQIKLEDAKNLVEGFKKKSDEIVSNVKNDDGYEQFYKFLRDNLKYSREAQANNIQGNVVANFIIDDKKMTSITIKPALGYGIEEGIKNVLKTFSPDIFSNGKYSIKIEHRLDGSGTKLLNEKAQTESGYIELKTITIMGFSSNTDDKIYSFVSLETPPKFPGGIAQFYKFLSANIKYPEKAIEANISGNVFVSFTVEKDGALTDIKVNRSLGHGTDEEAKRVLSLSPKWIPGSQLGKTVRVKYNLPIKFARTNKSVNLKGMPAINSDKKPLYIVDGEERNDVNAIKPSDILSVNVLKDAGATDKYGEKGKNGVIIITMKSLANNDVKTEDNTVYSFVSMENPPSYPGGIDAFYRFLSSSIKYPKKAYDDKIQGNVFVSFVVEKDGSLSNIKVDRPLGHGTDEEAVRVLSLSRRWNAGMQQGKPVRVKYNIPIKFSLKK
jgi:TonB family protein